MYELKITIPGLPKLSMNGAHSTWRVKLARTRLWQKAVMLAVGHQKPETPLTKAQITYTRHSSSRPDHDNLVASFKAIQDGLKMAGIILDDKFDIIGVPKYLHEKAKPGLGFVTIEIQQVMDDGAAHGGAFIVDAKP